MVSGVIQVVGIESLESKLVEKFPEIFKPVSGGEKIPSMCNGCKLHVCSNCPNANDYMVKTRGYNERELYNPDSKLNSEIEEYIELMDRERRRYEENCH